MFQIPTLSVVHSQNDDEKYTIKFQSLVAEKLPVYDAVVSDELIMFFFRIYSYGKTTAPFFFPRTEGTLSVHAPSNFLKSLNTWYKHDQPFCCINIFQLLDLLWTAYQ